MAWLRLDDGFAEHPKLIALTDRDFRTWVELLCYCARRGTKGHVPEEVGSVLARVNRRFLTRTFELGLLEEDVERGGWQIHDWLLYNGKSEDLREKIRDLFAKNPEISANDLLRIVGGKREVVLAEVAQLRERAGSDNGSREPGEAVPDPVPFSRARAQPHPQEPLGVKPSGGSKGSRPREPHAPTQQATSRAPRCPDCEVGGGLHAADCPRAPKS